MNQTEPRHEADRTAPRRHLGWLVTGWLCMALGTLGIVVPLLPTLDFYGLAALSFARGSPRCEAWLMNHPRLGPLLRDWRADRSVPLSAKCLATLSMLASCLWAAHALPARVALIPALACALVGLYLWTRPTRRARRCPLAAAPESRCPPGARSC